MIRLIAIIFAISIILLISGYHFNSNDLKIGGSLTMLTAWGLSYQVFRWMREDYERSVSRISHEPYGF